MDYDDLCEAAIEPGSFATLRMTNGGAGDGEDAISSTVWLGGGRGGGGGGDGEAVAGLVVGDLEAEKLVDGGETKRDFIAQDACNGEGVLSSWADIIAGAMMKKRRRPTLFEMTVCVTVGRD